MKRCPKCEQQCSEHRDVCPLCAVPLVCEPALPDRAVFESTDMVLALEAIYAAIVDMEEFVNSSTNIHYNRRAQLRAKTAAVKEAVQMVRQNQ